MIFKKIWPKTAAEIMDPHFMVNFDFDFDFFARNLQEI